VDSQPIESVAQTQDAVPAKAVAQPPADAETTTAATTKVVYRVKSGDTLSSIARVFRTSVASLKKWNSLSGNTIRVGDRLTILTTPPAVAFTN
jgi:membrane-bound lytic murein transglycosylase D